VFGLYLVTDRAAVPGGDLDGGRGADGDAPRQLVRAVARALAAAPPGAVAVQLREKDLGGRDLLRLAEEVRAVTRAAGAALLVNDRVDVAKASGADGVHLGQEDMSVVTARDILGPVPFIGLSVKTVEQARAVPLGIVDYVGIGGVFGTTSKTNTSRPIGPDGLARIVGVFRERIGNFPTCGIAGITAANAAQVIAAGADGVSVISALSRAPDPTAAARELRAIVDAALERYAPTPPAVGAGHGGNA
jgi:thiamine-phosphate pyrophosphorylase